MTVFNVMEQITNDIFEEIQKHYELKCNCEKCKDDILALTLNHVPTKYVATEKGELYVKALYQNLDLKHEILRELTRSIQFVEQNPHH